MKNKKSRVRETKNLLTDADSSTDTKKILLVRQNLSKIKNKKLRCDLTPFMSKSIQIWDHSFPFLPKYSKNLKSLDIGLQELGAKRRLNGVNKWKKSVKKTFSGASIQDHFGGKCLNLRPLFPLLLPQGFRISKNLDIKLPEVGTKICLNNTKKILTWLT